MPEPENLGRPTTIVDVAQRAGVAVSSVSRVMSNHPDVSQAMRLRVQAAADELGFSPDPSAQSLRSGSSRLIGFVVRDFANPFFAEIIHGVEESLDAAGYTLLIMSGGGDPRREVERISVLRQRRVDALLLSSTSESDPSVKRAVASFKRPVVLLDRDLGSPQTGVVRLDHATGVREATEDLISLGHKRIALITGSTDILPTRARLQGYHEALTLSKIPLQPDLEVSGAFSEAFAKDATARLLRLPKARRPTALISGGVQSTIGMLEELNDRGMRAGEDISVVVCDDLAWLRVWRPAISAVTRDGDAMGRAAADMAVALINGVPPHTVELSTKYERRATSIPVANRRAP